MSRSHVLSMLSLVACAGLAVAQETKPIVKQPEPMRREEPVKQPPIKKPIIEEKKGMEPPAPPKERSGPPGTVSFEKTDMDFGVISDEKPLETEYKFTNTGKGVLEFTQQPRGSCGCTVPNLDKLVYEPGESGSIKVTFNPHGKRDKAHTTVTVTTDDPEHPTTTLNINADVRPILRIEPTVIPAGSAERGQKLTQTVQVISRKPDIAVTQVTPSSPRVTIETGQPETVTEGSETFTKTTLTVSIAPNATAGPLQENITIRTTDPSRVLNAFVTGEVVGLIQPTPNALNFPMMTMNQPITSKVRLTPRKGNAFKVLSVKDNPVAGSSTQGFQFEIKEDTSSTPSTWEVSGNAVSPAAPGRIQGEWIITTDLPDEPTISIKYQGFVRTAPAQQPNDPSWQQNPSSLIPSGG